MGRPLVAGLRSTSAAALPPAGGKGGSASTPGMQRVEGEWSLDSSDMSFVDYRSSKKTVSDCYAEYF